MKKTILIMIMVLILVFTGCAKQASDLEKNTENKVSEVKETKQAEESGETGAGIVKVSGSEAKKFIEEQGAILVDVRTKAEYDDGHIDGAMLISLDELEGVVEEKLENKDTPVVVYCRSGRRSGIAAEILLSKGYKSIYDLGAMSSWKE